MPRVRMPSLCTRACIYTSSIKPTSVLVFSCHIETKTRVRLMTYNMTSGNHYICHLSYIYVGSIENIVLLARVGDESIQAPGSSGHFLFVCHEQYSPFARLLSIQSCGWEYSYTRVILRTKATLQPLTQSLHSRHISYSH